MPPEAMFGATRKSVTRQSSTDGTSTIWLRAREYDASTSSFGEKTPSYFTVWLLPPYLSSSLNCAVFCREQREVRCGPLSPLGRIAEERRVHVVARVHLPRALRGVRGDLALAIDAAEVVERESRASASTLSARATSASPTRVDRPEEEQPVLNDRPAERDADVASRAALGLHGAVLDWNCLPVALDAARPRVAEHAAVRVVGAALGDDVDDAADGLAELGLVAARLHLHFLDEVVRRAVAERAEDDRVRPERAVAGCS